MRRKWLAPLVGATLLLIACSSDASRSGAAASDATVTGDSTTTSIVIGSDGSSTAIVAPDEAASSTIDDAVPRAGGGVAPAEVDSTGPPGSFAPGILGAPSTEIAVDLRSQADSAGPPQQSIDHVTSVLGQVSGKPVRWRDGPLIAGGAQDWTSDELRTVADDVRVVQQTPERAVIHLLFVHGTYGGDNSILGASIRGDIAAIFVDRVKAAATPLVGSTGIETAVVTHEVGHLLGLVDLYLHTGRQDPDHPGHSTNKNSVMYWAVESDLVANLLQGGPPRDFDSADLADLATIRNGG